MLLFWENDENHRSASRVQEIGQPINENILRLSHGKSRGEWLEKLSEVKEFGRLRSSHIYKGLFALFSYLRAMWTGEQK